MLNYSIPDLFFCVTRISFIVVILKSVHDDEHFLVLTTSCRYDVLDRAMTSSLAASTTVSKPKFRSVLPHEPLATDAFGYLHVQGGLCPRRRKNPDEPDDTKQQDSFWTREALTGALGILCAESRITSLGLPFAAREVVLLDTDAPYTKLRLVYNSPLEALHVLIAWRRLKLTPRSLFSQDHSSPDWTFASRQLQATQITTRPLPPLAADISWNRASPPKFRRLLARPGEDVALLQNERNRTRFVFVSNLVDDKTNIPGFWSDAHVVSSAIRAVVDEYDTSGLGAEVFVHHKKMAKYCHLGMRSAQDARTIIATLQEKRVKWKWTDESNCEHVVQSGPLFLDYAAITQRSAARALAHSRGKDAPKGVPTRSECTSVTEQVTVPGLALITDFVSEKEEAALMAVLTGPQAPWAPSQSTPTEGGVVKRRVQHYGYVFDYESADVLRDREVEGASCPPMPAMEGLDQNEEVLEDRIADCLEHGCGWEALAGIVERIRRFPFTTAPDGISNVYPDLNQLTVNLYAPGEGIGSHVDTRSAFGDGLISLSLNGGIVMEFRKVGSHDHENGRKLVYLPPRSLLLMSGDSRYAWEHMIVNRMTDTHNGMVIPRKLRVSLTLRTALDLDGRTMPRVESSLFPPVWGEQSLSSSLKTPHCEKDHVSRCLRRHCNSMAQYARETWCSVAGCNTIP